jgi:hypothetical protein
MKALELNPKQHSDVGTGIIISLSITLQSSRRSGETWQLDPLAIPREIIVYVFLCGTF